MIRLQNMQNNTIFFGSLCSLDAPSSYFELFLLILQTFFFIYAPLHPSPPKDREEKSWLLALPPPKSYLPHLCLPTHESLVTPLNIANKTGENQFGVIK